MKGIFAEQVFRAVAEEEIVAANMKGFKDPALRDYTLMPFGALLKKESKKDGLEREYIASFLTGAEELARMDDKRRRKFGAVQVFYDNSLAMVVFYLSRHCVELSIKRAIKKLGGVPKHGHNLENLWNSFIAHVNEMKTNEDEQTLRDMLRFVRLINEYDESGTKLRYSETSDGAPAFDMPYFLNTLRLVEVTGIFVNQLEQILPAISQGPKR